MFILKLACFICANTPAFENERIKKYSKFASGDLFNFPVLRNEEDIVSADSVSQIIECNMIPTNPVFYIYADRDICLKVKEDIKDFLNKEI